MEGIIFAVVGLLLGGILVFLWMNGRLSRSRTVAEMKTHECEEQMVKYEQMGAENRNLLADNQTLRRELAICREQMAREDEARNRHFKEQLELVREQLQNASREMLRQRTQELDAQNVSQMNAIINPLKETISSMKAAMDQSRDTHNRNTASLEKAIEDVMKRTQEIGAEADRLATALRNENKVQGNWGEMILDELLESQGLKEGIHYEKQVTLRDRSGKAILNEESGKRMIPDTILHYPDGKDAVIDSKVSLTAFVDYQNAETDEQRAEALQRHVKSVRQHVAELARKDYSAYIKSPRQALNYVIMFVPNEGALQLALSAAPNLWREAFSTGVFITGEQNLIAALRIIQIAWTQMQQAQNQEAIYDTARMLLDRVADFIGHFETVGQKLQDASAYYVKAADKLKDGRLSVVGAANKLIKLGAKTSAKKVIPEENEPLRGVE